MVQISAHCDHSDDAKPITCESYTAALASGAEYAEFDIRKTADNVLVVYHDARAGRGGPLVRQLGHPELCDRLGYQVPRVDEVMGLIAGRLLGHLDLKETGYEAEVVGLAGSILGPANFVATTLEDASVAAIKRAYPEVRTALSLGRSLGDVPPPVGGHPAPRAVPAAPDPGLRCGLGSSQLPAGPAGRGPGLPPAGHRHHGVDGGHRAADRSLPAGPADRRADHQPAPARHPPPGRTGPGHPDPVGESAPSHV